VVLHIDSIDDLVTFLQARAEALAMGAAECGLNELGPDWEVIPRIIHSLKGFFDFIGVNITKANGREVAGWKQPMIRDAGGVVAVVRQKCVPLMDADGVCIDQSYFLVRAKAEPGNIGFPLAGGVNSRVLLSPPLQFSMANLQNNPGKIPLVALVLDDNGQCMLTTEPAPEDGGRFYEKVNQYSLVDIAVGQGRAISDEIEKLGPGAADFAWIKDSLLRGMFRAGWANGHLRSAMSLLV